MKCTYDHNVIFVREVLHLAPWLHRYGTTERGEVWSKIADNLNAVEKPSFKVTQRSVRDRYSQMEKNHKTKVAHEERASGICPEESEVDQAMEEIIQLFEDHDRENEKLSDEKKKKAEEDVTKAEEMRRQSLQTFKETQRRKESETPPKKKRASGSDTMNYLKEISEAESKRRAEELELRRKEMEKQSELQREELKMRKQEQDDKRNQNEAMHQQMMMRQQQLQLLMQQQQQQSTVMMALLEKALAAKK